MAPCTATPAVFNSSTGSFGGATLNGGINIKSIETLNGQDTALQCSTDADCPRGASAEPWAYAWSLPWDAASISYRPLSPCTAMTMLCTQHDEWRCAKASGTKLHLCGILIISLLMTYYNQSTFFYLMYYVHFRNYGINSNTSLRRPR